MPKKLLCTLCLLILVTATVVGETRLGFTMGGGGGYLCWGEEFKNELKAAGFEVPGTVYNFYGGSEFRLNEKWLLRNLGQGLVGQVQKDKNQTQLTVAQWTVSAQRMWELQPKLELGVGVLGGVGAFSMRLRYGQEEDAGPFAPDLKELADKFFFPVGPVASLRYTAGIQTLTVEALYLLPQNLNYGLTSGLQVQVGLSYDLGY